MKLYENSKTEETLDRLPEMPEGVVVPDNISGLQLPTAPKPTAGAYRWMRWLAAIVVFGAAGVLAAVLITGGDNASETSQVEADRFATDFMATYGTDNPVFVAATGPMATYGTDNPVFVAATEPMATYGTDNPVFVQPATFADTGELVGTLGTVDTGQYLERYGTDNPVFVAPAGSVATYGADNPAFVAATDFMARYGTDNPVFVQAATSADAGEFLGTFGTVDTSQYLELYGTDNPALL
jgi:hypothetical protein